MLQATVYQPEEPGQFPAILTCTASADLYRGRAESGEAGFREEAFREEGHAPRWSADQGRSDIPQR
jgi:hypothetical protein